MDITHVYLAGGGEVEILNIIDDHSCLCVVTRVLPIYKAIDVVTTFHEAAARWAYPASALADNGAVFTVASRHGFCVMESELLSLGIAFKHSQARPSPDLWQGRALPSDDEEHLEVSKRARGISVLSGAPR